MSTDPAKQAAEARADLARILNELAAVLSTMGEILSTGSTALAEAIQKETAATGNYVAHLERELARARQEQEHLS
jgi:hypothetical protein